AAGDEDDAVAEEAAEDVVGAFAAAGVLDDDGDELGSGVGGVVGAGVAVHGHGGAVDRGGVVVRGGLRSKRCGGAAGDGQWAVGNGSESEVARWPVTSPLVARSLPLPVAYCPLPSKVWIGRVCSGWWGRRGCRPWGAR